MELLSHMEKSCSVLPPSKFLNSDRLGKKYENDLFVGCVNLGIIFHFGLNEDRTN